MNNSADKIRLTSYEDIFKPNGAQESEKEKIQEIALSELFPFHSHPFKVLDDEAMQELINSIKAHGILNPAIARPLTSGGYELLSGHRRKHAAELAGLETMPVIVRDLDDDQSILIMVDSNVQRENILPSEKAWAYKMRLDAMKRQAGRPSQKNGGQVDPDLMKGKSRDILAEQVNESPKQVQRYIRLTELVPKLLDTVDSGALGLTPAVELSYLTESNQQAMLDFMEQNNIHKIKGEHAKALRSQQEIETSLSEDTFEIIFSPANNNLSAVRTVKLELPAEQLPADFQELDKELTQRIISVIQEYYQPLDAE